MLKRLVSTGRLPLSMVLLAAIGFGTALLILRPAEVSAERPISYSGSGYGYLVDDQRRCVMAWANTTPPTTISCQEGAPLWRSDNSTWYSMQSGSWAAMAPTFGAITSTGAGVTSSGVGTVSGTGVTVVENGTSTVHRSTFTLAALSLTMTDVGGTSSTGAQKIYTFPEGVIQIIGASCNLTTLAGSGGITDTAAVVESLGSATVVNDNATLTTTEADIIASYAGTLTGGIGVFTKYGSLVAAAFDGHTTPTAAFLNVAVPDAGSSSNDTFALTGTCQIVWSNLGDF